jgi:predicted phosphoribosyltransferase
MSALFLNRTEAGRQLAARLAELRSQPEVIVLGLPRGGVPVAHEVARALGAPLDIFTVRKIGVPAEPELAMGAVASGGVRVVNTEVVRMLGIERRVFDQVTEAEQRELARREERYRQGRPFPPLRGATVVLVDDGVATGSTMRAAVLALRQHEPATIIVATPVMSLSAKAALEQVADRCVFVATPEPFFGVAAWYRDFTQTTDEEVDALLAARAGTPPDQALAGNPV